MKAFIEPINSPESVRSVMERAFRHAQRAAGEGMHEVVIRAANKSRAQEECYHALIGDISEQYEHAGRRWDKDSMKRLLVDAFKHETYNDPENFPELRELWDQMGSTAPVPAIGRDGFVLLGEQTRRFPRKLAGAFITWLHVFMAENRIACTDPKWAAYDGRGDERN